MRTGIRVAAIAENLGFARAHTYMSDRVAATDTVRQHVYLHKKDFVCRGACAQLRKAGQSRMGIPAVSVFNHGRGDWDHYCGDRLLDFTAQAGMPVTALTALTARAHVHAVRIPCHAYMPTRLHVCISTHCPHALP